MLYAEKPSLEEIAHFGVKGMHWGQHKTIESMTREEKTARIKKLESKMDRLNMGKALDGIGVKGFYAKKLNKKQLKKNPNFFEDFKKASPEEQRAYEKKISSMAKRRMLLNGAVGAAGVLAVGNIAVSHLGYSPSVVKQGRIGVAVMATIPLRETYHSIRAVQTADKRDKLLTEINALKPQKVRNGSVKKTKR